MSTPRRPGLSDFPRGFGILLNGFGMVLREGRRFWLGALPPLVTSVVFFGLFLLLASNATAIIAASPLAFAGVLGAIGLLLGTAGVLAGSAVQDGGALVIVIGAAALALTKRVPTIVILLLAALAGVVIYT